MCRVPLACLAQQKRELLANSQSTPPFYISIERQQYDEELKAVVYDCQVGIQENTDVVIHIVKTRFSHLAQFDKHLRKTEVDLRPLKPFPKKRWIGNTEESFLAERRRDLQEYLRSLTQISGILQKPCFRKFTTLTSSSAVE
jgi:hypothetical protein